MTKEEIVESIGQNYSSLTSESKKDFINNSKLITLDKPSKIVTEGQYFDKAYYIVKGCARAYYLQDGRDITDWFAFENTFICSINSFFLDIPSQHYIEILEPAVLLEVSRKDIEALSDKHHEIERLFRIITTCTMLQLQERVVSLQFKTAEQKYNSTLSIYPDITQRVPLKHIASYIGITLETLSRIRSPKKANLI